MWGTNLIWAPGGFATPPDVARTRPLGESESDCRCVVISFVGVAYEHRVLPLCIIEEMEVGWQEYEVEVKE